MRSGRGSQWTDSDTHSIRTRRSRDRAGVGDHRSPRGRNDRLWLQRERHEVRSGTAECDGQLARLRRVGPATPFRERIPKRVCLWRAVAQVQAAGPALGIWETP